MDLTLNEKAVPVKTTVFGCSLSATRDKFRFLYHEKSKFEPYTIRGVKFKLVETASSVCPSVIHRTVRTEEIEVS